MLETAWEVLVRSISGAKDLDEVIAAHDTYLDAVLERSLLSPSTGKRGADDAANGATLRRQLHTLFDTCIEFCKMQEEFFTRAHMVVRQLQVFRQRVKDRTKEGQWGLTGEEDEGPAEMGDGGAGAAEAIGREYKVKVTTLKDKYGAQFAGLIDALQPFASGENVQYLVTRLSGGC